MRRLLDEEATIFLRIRVLILRSTGLFKFEELITNWKMARSTLYRYISPEYREYSRRMSKVKWKTNPRCLTNKKRDITKCQICRKSLKTHARCIYCTILLHKKPCSCSERIALLQPSNVQYDSKSITYEKRKTR